MRTAYYLEYPIRCRVPAPSVRFGEGEWMVTVRQSLGKGAVMVIEDETRRSRKAASLIALAATAEARQEGLSCRG